MTHEQVNGSQQKGTNSNETGERASEYYGPFFLTDIQVIAYGTIYYVDKPGLLPQNAVAVRVPKENAALETLMRQAFYTGKPVTVAPGIPWYLKDGTIALTIFAAKLAFSSSFIQRESGPARGGETLYGPFFLKSVLLVRTGTVYYVDDPGKLPQKLGVAIYVRREDTLLESYLTNAFFNGKSVRIATSSWFNLDNNDTCWAVFQARIDF
ncbi:MAG: hypothetical protein QG657_2926 [Acidobacteriota bacterium]|nr:hypothetical protein [Acidobacteriota bacterium]